MDAIGSRIGLIGAGNMARAIVLGGLRGRHLDPSRVAVADPDESKHAAFVERGIRTFDVARRVVDWALEDAAGQVLFAVKPQVFAGVAAELRVAPASYPSVVISIMAGLTSERVQRDLGGGVRVVRVMPNVAASIGRSVTAVSLGAGAQPGDDAVARRLFAGVGPIVEPIDERLMNAFTALIGSGPAYVFLLTETLTRAGTDAGFEPAVADRIVRGMLSGAAELLAQSGQSPQELRESVTSRGGTTEAALAVLAANDWTQAILSAVRAGAERGAQLGSSS